MLFNREDKEKEEEEIEENITSINLERSNSFTQSSIDPLI